MLDNATRILRLVADQTDRAVLFHSGSGKDSIALLDLAAPLFKEVVCVYMRLVPNLSHIARYIAWSEKKYPNCRFVQAPHFALGPMARQGYLGCSLPNPPRLWTMMDIDRAVRQKEGAQWSLYGFKQSDSMNRRVMLRTLQEAAVNPETRKAYPLSTYKNAQVLEYIKARGLMAPERYGKGQSSGCDVSDPCYLAWLRDNFPDDLARTIAMFPRCERLLYEHDYKTRNGKGQDT